MVAAWKADGPARGTRVRISHSLPGNIMLKNFEIDDQYIIDISVRIEHDYIKDRANATHEDLIKILKGHDKCYIISNKDHDEFTKLRDQLEELGYITTVRNSWNGDRILKSFKLNGWTMRKGHKFPCAAALRCSIDCAKTHGWKSISNY